MQQADRAHSATDALASPGNDREISTSRRTALVGLTIGAASAALLASSRAGAEQSASVSAPMRAALEAEKRAERQSETYHDQVYVPARRRLDDSERAIPHVVYDINKMHGVYAVWSTASAGDVTHCKRVVSNEAYCDDRKRPAREFLAIVEKREEKLASLRATSGFDEIYERSDRLADRAYRAAVAVIELPSQSLQDLCAKVELAERRFDTDGWVWEAVVADIRRLA
ncbi:hypothetical protein GCM10011380_15470 [Sphingomonas metalli]|uniref:Uncharacterized protein n=1 Tax=Sphingomonas metalli TaxID=1779358 RepID=A0A916T0P9_9SPHN|nr:hypothetical protein GCM10011380_15470 [Sphingomonas metalli]